MLIRLSRNVLNCNCINYVIMLFQQIMQFQCKISYGRKIVHCLAAKHCELSGGYAHRTLRRVSASRPAGALTSRKARAPYLQILATPLDTLLLLVITQCEPLYRSLSETFVVSRYCLRP